MPDSASSAPTLSHADFITYSAVRLISVSNGSASGSGTGFFYTVKLQGTYEAILIVTNKHVIEGADEIVFDMHIRDGTKDSGQTERFRYSVKTAPVIHHPRADVDLCAIPISGVIEQMNEIGRLPYFATLTSKNIPNSDEWPNFSAIQPVTMAGFPNGLADEKNHMPLVRRGITATSLARDYNGRTDFMVDMACFPGSSGSPIFVWDPVMTVTSTAIRMGEVHFALVGILYQGPLINNSGQIVMGVAPSVAVSTMMHLGQAIKSSELLALEAVVRAMAKAEEAK